MSVFCVVLSEFAVHVVKLIKNFLCFVWLHVFLKLQIVELSGHHRAWILGQLANTLTLCVIRLCLDCFSLFLPLCHQFESSGHSDSKGLISSE